jgi:uncharacterized membrane protein YkvA (DUF1232 family)
MLVSRTITALALLPMASRLPVYARLTTALLRDPRVPGARKAVLGVVLAYTVFPRDLIPDRLPFVGVLDDLAVSILGIDLFLAGVPEAILDEKLTELGIDRTAWDEDVARIRRLIPRPVRRIITAVPGALGAAGRYAARVRPDQRPRGEPNLEGSPA